MSSLAVTSPFEAVGRLLALATMSKVSLTDPPLPSLAVTFTETVPTSATCGIPEKVRVVGVKVSHVGSPALSAFVAM